MKPLYLSALGLVNSLGSSKEEVLDNLLSIDSAELSLQKAMIKTGGYVPGKDTPVGSVKSDLPEIDRDGFGEYETRCNKMLLLSYKQIESEVDNVVQQYGADRVGVVIGTSTSGIEEGEQALFEKIKTGKFPEGYFFKKQELGTPAEFLAEYIGLGSVAYSISTACSSSAKTFASARNLIESDICDAVLVGGADSLCQLTLNGFNSLESLSSDLCNPFSSNRVGINIGEGAALFLLTKEVSDIALLGVGETSDAHHATAPHPEGEGAIAAMQQALDQAGLNPSDIDYLNLHGTATIANDLMESKAVATVFKDNPVLCSSTKPLTGHALGAAGATEAAFCWLLLDSNKNKLPVQIWDGQRDEKTEKINLVEPETANHELNVCMSNSFAFGGNNASVILGKI